MSSPPVIVSFPAPAMIVSSPVPPLSISLPNPPRSVSLFAPPESESLPAPPVSVSSPPLPLSVSGVVEVIPEPSNESSDPPPVNVIASIAASDRLPDSVTSEPSASALMMTLEKSWISRSSSPTVLASVSKFRSTTSLPVSGPVPAATAPVTFDLVPSVSLSRLTVRLSSFPSRWLTPDGGSYVMGIVWSFAVERGRGCAAKCPGNLPPRSGDKGNYFPCALISRDFFTDRSIVHRKHGSA